MEWLIAIAAGYLIAFVIPGAVKVLLGAAAVAAGLLYFGPEGVMGAGILAVIWWRYGR